MTGPLLVAADFNDQIETLVRTARNLSERMNVAVLLVHVVEPIEEPETADSDTRQFHEELLRKARERLAEYTTGWSNVTPLVQLGHRVEEILRLCASQTPSMLVMGASPERTQHMSIGLQVFLRCNCPILSVPAEARDRDPVPH